MNDRRGHVRLGHAMRRGQSQNQQDRDKASPQARQEILHMARYAKKAKNVQRERKAIAWTVIGDLLRVEHYSAFERITGKQERNGIIQFCPKSSPKTSLPNPN